MALLMIRVLLYTHTHTHARARIRTWNQVCGSVAPTLFVYLVVAESDSPASMPFVDIFIVLEY